MLGAANKGSNIEVFLIGPGVLLLQRKELTYAQLLEIPQLAEIHVQAD